MKLIHVIFLFLVAFFCMKTSCRKDVLCDYPRDKQQAVFHIAPHRAQYGLQDSISFRSHLPLSTFAVYSTNPDSVKALKGFMFYQLIELFTPAGDSNARIADSSFTHFHVKTDNSAVSTVWGRRPHQVFYKYDPVQRGFDLEVSLLPRKKGHFALRLWWGTFTKENNTKCRMAYYLQTEPFIPVTARNSQIPATLGITNELKFKNPYNKSVSKIPIQPESIFFFTVQ